MDIFIGIVLVGAAAGAVYYWRRNKSRKAQGGRVGGPSSGERVQPK